MLESFVINLSQLETYVRTADFDRLYCALAGPLERMVRSEVRACDAVIEDACQMAWLQLLGHADRVRSSHALSWLATTAIHEARRLVRRADRDLPLEEVTAPAIAPGPEESVEFRERLASLRRLPERQQRMLWLRGLGPSYADIAVSTGCTLRTVERQVLRAQRTMRAAA
jgi:RNA polymerase sigma factor (sigma-70 family)